MENIFHADTVSCAIKYNIGIRQGRRPSAMVDSGRPGIYPLCMETSKHCQRIPEYISSRRSYLFSPRNVQRKRDAINFIRNLLMRAIFGSFFLTPLLAWKRIRLTKEYYSLICFIIPILFIIISTSFHQVYNHEPIKSICLHLML